MTAPLTVADLLSAYYADRAAIVADGGRSIQQQINRVCRLLGALVIEEVTQETIDYYISTRQAAGVTEGTARAEACKLVTAINWIGGQKLQLPKIQHLRRRTLAPQELRALILAARPTLRTFIHVAIATGARLSAICELTWDRVNFEQGIIDFRAPHPRAARRKGRAVVPMSDKLRAILAERKPVSRDNRVIGANAHTIGLSFRLARRRAGLGDDITPHTLRHTAATHMIKQRVPLIEVSRLLGHSSVKTTEEIYIHLRPNDLRRAADALSGLL